MSRADILLTLDQHEDMLRRLSVKRIGLFGSFVRDQAQLSSDVDLLVEFEKPTYDNFYDLSVSLERLLGRPAWLPAARASKLDPMDALRQE